MKIQLIMLHANDIILEPFDDLFVSYMRVSTCISTKSSLYLVRPCSQLNCPHTPSVSTLRTGVVPKSKQDCRNMCLRKMIRSYRGFRGRGIEISCCSYNRLASVCKTLRTTCQLHRSRHYLTFWQEKAVRPIKSTIHLELYYQSLSL